MHIVIIGAGIAGLAAAVALRTLGARVEVYERRARDPEGGLGAGVVCWPNAAFALDALGVLDQARARGHQITAMRRLSCEGRALGELPITEIDDALGYTSFAIERAVLHGLLLARAEEAGARVYFGSGATEITSERSGARVHLETGQVLQADLIVGADGRMRSVARRFVAASDLGPRDCGFVNWIGTVQTPGPAFEAGVVLDLWGVGARFGVVPLSRSRAYWAAGIARPSNDRGSDPHWSECFASWPAPIPELLEARAVSETREIQIFDLEPLPCWHRHNVLLIGDAAHAAAPTSGQGVGQALEDVWALRGALEEASDISVACERVFAARAEKAASIARVGRTMAASLFDTDSARCAERDARSAETDFPAAARGIATLWGRGLPLGSHATDRGR